MSDPWCWMQRMRFDWYRATRDELRQRGARRIRKRIHLSRRRAHDEMAVRRREAARILLTAQPLAAVVPTELVLVMVVILELGE